MKKKPKMKPKKRELSAYEENALREIRAWKKPKPSWLDGTAKLATRRLLALHRGVR